MNAAQPPNFDAADGPRVVRDATCTFCGCACDDIELSVERGRIVSARRACGLGEQWFLDERGEQRPACTIEGQAADVAEGIERAAALLVAAGYPLVYGLGDTTSEAQRLAVSIADWLGGAIDTSTSFRHGPSGVAFQGVGEVTCSLGEVANRGDLVIFWGCDPAEHYPRHFERYSLFPQGMFVPRGRADRTCVLVDVRPTRTAAEADLFLQIDRARDFEALWILRALARGIRLDAAEVRGQTGVELAAWQDLIERMKRARFGVLLFGNGLASSRGRYLNTEAVLALVRDLNAYTRFVARPMRGRGNVTGADNVLTWRTGYPFGVNLARGYPRYNPGEYTVEELLARGEVDAALIVADASSGELSARARARLAHLPRVVVGGEPTAADRRGATVVFATATYGIHAPGTVYRMDDVPLLLRPAVASPLPSDVDILARLEQRVRSLQAEAHAP